MMGKALGDAVVICNVWSLAIMMQLLVVPNGVYKCVNKSNSSVQTPFIVTPLNRDSVTRHYC